MLHKLTQIIANTARSKGSGTIGVLNYRKSMAKRVTVPLEDEMYDWVLGKAEDEVRTVPNFITALIKREMDKDTQPQCCGDQPSAFQAEIANHPPGARGVDADENE